MEFLRRCPSCGRRFTVKVERKEIVEREEDTMRIVHNVVVPRIGYRGGGVVPVAAVAEEVPIERDTFKISYECKSCHHEWSEMVPVVKKEGGGPNQAEFTKA